MTSIKASNSKQNRNPAPLIYVVDDEPMLLELASVVLEPHGYQIKTFRDPAAALMAFRNANPRPAVIITDYAMHQMNGMDLITECKTQISPHANHNHTYTPHAMMLSTNDTPAGTRRIQTTKIKDITTIMPPTHN